MNQYIDVSILSKFNDLEVMVLIYLLVVNILSFLAMYLDKSKARNKKGRISENTLMILSVIGGAAGSLIGMTIFRHKTSKKKFYIGVPLIYIITQMLIILIFNHIK